MSPSSEIVSVGLVLQENLATLALVTSSLLLLLFYGSRKFANTSDANGKKLPPHIPSTVPFLGHAVSFGKSPLEFLLAAYKQYGPVFSFTMVGKTFTYLIGSDASTVFFNGRNAELNAEDVYSRLTTPVFGAGVAYDCPHHVFLEQKKMFKTGLNIERFKSYIPIIVYETRTYFKKWGHSGQKDLFLAFSQLIILTASACLHGPEIRSVLDESVAQLYWDLDGGFTPEAWLLPPWVPLPSFRRRDAAHKKVKQIFYNVIRTRRETGVTREDMLQTLLDSTYKSGRSLTDDEVAGMLIGLLLAGQHTSSTTSTWLGFYLAANKHIQTVCAEEQKTVFGVASSVVDYDGLKECEELERCIKETLRLRPPIMTMMRMCKTPLEVNGYRIPPGHQVCVSPTTNHTLPDVWTDPSLFDPNRFLSTFDQKFSYVPFGAGRHRCIGETFAYLQIKTIWSTLLREYEFDLIDDHFPEINYTTMIHTPRDPVIAYKRRIWES